MSFLPVLVRFTATCAVVLLTVLPVCAQLRSSVYVSGLSSPVAFVQDPSNAALQYVAEQGGTIRVIQNGTLLPTPFATISPIGAGGERGLLGLAFPPNYAASRRFYVNFTNPDGISSSLGCCARPATRWWPTVVAIRSAVARWSTLHPPSAGQPQRRPYRLRARRVSLYRHRRRRRRQRSRAQRAEPGHPPRQDAADRRLGLRRRFGRLQRPLDNPFVNQAGYRRRSGHSDFAIRGAGALTTRRSGALAP